MPTKIQTPVTSASAEVTTVPEHYKLMDNLQYVIQLIGDGFYPLTGDVTVEGQVRPAKDVNGETVPGTGLNVKVRDLLAMVEGVVLGDKNQKQFSPTTFTTVNVASAVGATKYLLAKAARVTGPDGLNRPDFSPAAFELSDAEAVDLSGRITVAKLTIPGGTTQVDAGMIDCTVRVYLKIGGGGGAGPLNGTPDVVSKYNPAGDSIISCSDVTTGPTVLQSPVEKDLLISTPGWSHSYPNKPGDVLITAGNVGGQAPSAGSVKITAGSGSSGSVSGNVEIRTALPSGGGALAGDVIVAPGGSILSGTSGGSVKIIAGIGSAAGGAVEIESGTSRNTGVGGTIKITAGGSPASTAGPNVEITAGGSQGGQAGSAIIKGGTSTQGNAGAVELRAGNSASGTPGDILLTPTRVGMNNWGKVLTVGNVVIPTPTPPSVDQILAAADTEGTLKWVTPSSGGVTGTGTDNIVPKWNAAGTGIENSGAAGSGDTFIRAPNTTGPGQPGSSIEILAGAGFSDTQGGSVTIQASGCSAGGTGGSVTVRASGGGSGHNSGGTLTLESGPARGAGQQGGNVIIKAAGVFDSATQGEVILIGPVTIGTPTPPTIGQVLSAASVNGLLAWVDGPPAVIPASVPKWYKYTATYAELAAAAQVNSITLFSLPAGGVITQAKIKHSAAFVGGSISGYSVGLGVAGDTPRYLGTKDLTIAPTPTYGDTSVSGSTVMEDQFNPTDILLTATSDSDNLDQATAGSVDVWVLWSVAV